MTKCGGRHPVPQAPPHGIGHTSGRRWRGGCRVCPPRQRNSTSLDANHRRVARSLSDGKALSANNQPACFSNGETLPPLGFAAELPSSLQRRSQLITELGLTSRSAATSCREAPPSTIAIARTRRSSEYGLAITLSFQKESRAPDSLIRRPLGIPRFEAGGICSSRPIHSD